MKRIFSKIFPTAMEMRERKNSLTVKDKLALNEIAKLLDDSDDVVNVYIQKNNLI